VGHLKSPVSPSTQMHNAAFGSGRRRIIRQNENPAGACGCEGASAGGVLETLICWVYEGPMLRGPRFANSRARQMKLPWMDPRLRELIALAALAAFGCGLALARGDFLFVAVFVAASAVTISEAIRRR